MPDLTATLPSYILAHSKKILIGEVPALIGIPEDSSNPPWLLWLHGRTANKEVDPGRYLRLLRSGIAFCAVDLPDHGERAGPKKDDPTAVLDIVNQMTEEIDQIVDWMNINTQVDSSRCAIGGMSAGGMSAIQRLTQVHNFIAASLEATTGNWESQGSRPMFNLISRNVLKMISPMNNLDQWTPLHVLAVHSKNDHWIDYEGQRLFIEKIKSINEEFTVKLISYENTGAPFEHIGFGNKSSANKDTQVNFLIEAFKV